MKDSKTKKENNWKIYRQQYPRATADAITHCYSYKRWKQIHHVMILKVPGVVKIHKLRIIALYESDLNLMLGNKWRAAMSEAGRQGTLIRHNMEDAQAETARVLP